MKKVLFINETCGTGSHGKICVALAKEYEKEGYEAKIAYGRSFFVPDNAKQYAVQIGNKYSPMFHAIYTRLTDRHGFGSYFATKKFIKWLDEYNPNVVWLHNIHGYYINIKLLFNWLKNHPDVEVKWTLHDCWSFTGHCSHFMAIGCEKWKTGCYKCPEKKSYPKSMLLDSSKRNYKDKKRLFTSLKNIEIVTPSKWLADQVKESYLSKYNVTVKYNDIDTNIFKPRKSNIKEQLHIENKNIVLAVASKWSERKGLYDLIEFSKLLDNQHVLVVIGLDQSQLNLFDKKVICILRTENQIQLAEYYSAAEWFVNFTYEDTYPTVNLEAEACGTKVITYDAGGSKETIHNKESIVIGVGEYKIAAQIINKQK